ncbi:hypothetical protein EDEG_00276 [Edhazardia aedis USNM 41457]|uniref:Transmembrane protein n=1 Tax=Edhazardia aedis (strain USNM 41457) TaxID=1003232 RepID=J8ZRZ7_EDHAE|nr:hypothetical protein EDEG_00276 [Edhazardia aedis USNM 41457]|eukprot:EJW02473.1 hypothetical protein EDEG_00276 [Edhazardia aedis USNM 41457]
MIINIVIYVDVALNYVKIIVYLKILYVENRKNQKIKKTVEFGSLEKHKGKHKEQICLLLLRNLFFFQCEILSLYYKRLAITKSIYLTIYLNIYTLSSSYF